MGKAARKANRAQRKIEEAIQKMEEEATPKQEETPANPNVIQTGNQTFAGAGTAEGIGS